MTSKLGLPANTLVQVFITAQPCNHLQKTVTRMTGAKHLLRVAGVCFSLALLSGCESAPPGDSPGVQEISIPANTPVHVVMTSESCNHLQRTEITWPNGSTQAFETPKAASPDSSDPGFDAAHPTVITYGTADYNGPGGNAVVKVFDFLKPGDKPDPTWTRKQTDKRVESEGHKNQIRVDWNDTIVSFSW